MIKFAKNFPLQILCYIGCDVVAILCYLCYCHGNTVANDYPSIDDKIYQLLDEVFLCSHLINATNQIGCTGMLLS